MVIKATRRLSKQKNINTSIFVSLDMFKTLGREFG